MVKRPLFWAFFAVASMAVFTSPALSGQNGPKPPAPVEALPAGAKAPGPVFCAAVRAHLRKEYRKRGDGLIESFRKANAVSDEMIAGMIPDAEKVASAKAGMPIKVGAIGDGKILDAIIDFFKSPQGQALMEALIKLLLGFLENPDPVSFWGSSLQSWNA